MMMKPGSKECLSDSIWVRYNDLTATSLRPHWNVGDCEGNHPPRGEVFSESMEITYMTLYTQTMPDL